MEAVAVLVTSCAAYAERALPPLLASMAAAGVSASDVFVVVGQAEEDGDGSLEAVAGFRVPVFRRRWANMDNNGLVWAARDPAAPELLARYRWLFYLHDTCRVEPGFAAGASAAAARLRQDASAARLHGGMSMSMGFYRPSALRDEGLSGSVLAPNYDTSREAVLRIKACVEDSVFQALGAAVVEVLPNAYEVVERDVRMYGTGVPRIVERYAVPGVLKAKANWERCERLDL